MTDKTSSARARSTAGRAETPASVGGAGTGTGIGPDASVDGAFAQALIEGLSAKPKSIPCRFFYDAAGSALFEQITDLPEYYPTRTEISILTAHVDEIVARIPDGALLIEFGSGSSRKTEILLDRAGARLAAYVPIDISQAAIEEAEARLRQRYPTLDIRGVVGPFDAPLPEIAGAENARRVGFFPGSTIGNLVVADAVALLREMRTTLGRRGRLIVGADLIKDPAVLVPAYDDAQGVTAAFNMNVLARANRELGARFNLDLFEHTATWNPDASRIEMHLVSRIDQTVTVLGRRFRFAAGERILTEHSHKYEIAGFHRMVRRAGWSPLATWTDPQAMFSVHMLESDGA